MIFPSAVESDPTLRSAQVTPYSAPGPYTNAPLVNSQPLYSQPPGGSYNYTGPPAYSGAPTATLPGTIEPVNPQWDPYADPMTQTPALLPQQNYFTTPQEPFTTRAVRLMQDLRFQYTWLAGSGGDEVGMNDLETSVSFAVPFFMDQAPLLITPGFAVRYWSGPSSAAVPGADLPPRVYDAYLGAAWRPQFTPAFGVDVGFQVGVFSDFKFFNSSESLRYRGHGLGVWTLSPKWQLVGGIVYLDRIDVKLLPAGGAIWMPNPDTRYEIIFPMPKLAQRFTTWGNTDIWLYVAGEYGGGAWSIERAAGFEDAVEYDDFRLKLGLEWISFQGNKGYFEVGYVFHREFKYLSDIGNFDPSDTVMLRAGISF